MGTNNCYESYIINDNIWKKTNDGEGRTSEIGPESALATRQTILW